MHSDLTRATLEEVEMALRRMAESETAPAVIEFLTQRQFEIETSDNVRPVTLTGNSGRNLLTLEDLRRYVIDRVGQFPYIDQRPNLYASGDRIGDYWCGDIPLRFAGPGPLP